MALCIQKQKSHGVPSGPPMAPVTMQIGSGAWVSPVKTKKEKKEIIELHPLLFHRMV